ncbi:MAG: sulfite exporter TauE/SafE family protein, partial [Pseudomonadota bacterium]
MDAIIADYGLLIGALVACGLFSGLVAGLFGIGGGAVIVPVLIILFESLGFDSTASHAAIATSLATIVLTSWRSVMAHHKLGAVDWTIVRAWAPWIMLGAILGQLVAGQL